VLATALGKIFAAVTASTVNGYFAEWQTKHSAKNFKFFFPKKALPSAANPGTRQRVFLICF
jgi:hypothetical protein